MSRNKNIIRVGDIVRITNPNFFVRCGYALDFNSACELVEERDADKIEQCLRILLDLPTEDKREFFAVEMAHSKFKKHERSLQNDIIRAMAYHEVGLQYKTGNERKIYTQELPLLKDKRYQVYEKKCVKTGKYYPPSGGYDSYSGEYDYESGGLYEEKTHIILSLNEYMGFYQINTGLLMIEACNVEKVNE